jgi:AAA-like domain
MILQTSTDRLGRYNPNLYAPRPQIEARFRAEIARRFVTLVGPERIGKSWLLHHMFGDPTIAAVKHGVVNLALSRSDLDASTDALFKEIGRRMVVSVDGDPSWLKDAWASSDLPRVKLSNLLGDFILPSLDGRGKLLLALDWADDLVRHARGSELVGLLRTWSTSAVGPRPRGAWGNLRVVLVLQSDAATRNDPYLFHYLNVTAQIRVGDMTRDELAELVGRYGVPWSAADIAPLTRLIGGHPELFRFALMAYGPSFSMAEIIDEGQIVQGDGAFGTHLRWLLSRLKESPALHRAVECITRNEPAPDDDAIVVLERMGLVERKGNAVQFRYPLYRLFFCPRLGQR